MSVYVDPLMRHGWNYRGNNIKSCHLFADTEKELHEFAERIGLKRGWFQNKNIPHYDITASKRALALKEGASNVDKFQAVSIWEEIRRNKQNDGRKVRKNNKQDNKRPKKPGSKKNTLI
jgi:hypothetical protein